MFESWALLLILGAPLLGALGVAAFRNGTGSAARAIAMSAMLVVLVAALRIFFVYDATTDAARFALDVAVDAIARHPLSCRRGRLQHLSVAGRRPAVSRRARGKLDHGGEPPAAVSRAAAHPADQPVRCLRRAEPGAVLRLLGDRADSHGHPDPRLRWARAACGGDDVLHVHAGRQRSAAGRGHRARRRSDAPDRPMVLRAQRAVRPAIWIPRSRCSSSSRSCSPAW